MFTGYYELEKYLDTGIEPRNRRGVYRFKDYALLAKKTHFVKDGIPLTGDTWSKIPDDAITDDGIVGYGPRDSKEIPSTLAKGLKKKLDEQKDITAEYISEIHKSEENNLKNSNGKYRYPSWERETGFTKKDIQEFIK